MNLVEATLNNRTTTLVLTFVLIVGGYLAFDSMGRLEDPEFTVKDAQIFTKYPGATAEQVEEEVTNQIEIAVQQLGQLDLVESTSEPGVSTVQVTIKDKYDRDGLPQVWDELRRKVGDARKELPPEASASLVFDDFGDVFGIYFAVYGDGYSYRDLHEHAKVLRRELLLVDDVAKISLSGIQQEVVYLEIGRSRLAQLGISPELIANTLSGQNQVAPAGRVRVDDLFLRIVPTGAFGSLEDIKNLFILQPDGKPSRLRIRDIAQLRRDYVDPPSKIVRFNGQPGIGVGISTVSGGNAVVMGNAVLDRLEELQAETPVGIEIGMISLQSESVETAISSFVVSLMQAIAIVVGVLMVAMSLRSGLLIGVVLMLTIMGTFILMKMNGILLERISLGALIIALGMLVDNAIVIVEGILINAQKGMSKREAAGAIVKQTMWPLFGATFVAILAFGPIGFSQDSTGEFCSSLFSVLFFSLLLSWLLAITVTPLFGVMFLKIKATPEGEDAADSDPYAGGFYRSYRACVAGCMRFRWVTLAVLIAMLVAGLWGFGFVRQSFFPPSTRPQFMVNYWLPQGTHIKRTEDDIAKLEAKILDMDGTSNVASVVGGGPPRFLLTLQPEDTNSAYGLLLVSVDDYKKIPDLRKKIQDVLEAEFPDAQGFSRTFMLGPGDPATIQARLSGPDHETLRKLSDEISAVLKAHPNVVDLNDDWRQRVPVVRPIVAESQARDAGITRTQINNTIQGIFEGQQVGYFRERDELLPIVFRSPEADRKSVDELLNSQIWSPVAGRTIPLSQVVSGFQTVSENARIKRRDRIPTLTVKCDPGEGEASALLLELKPQVEERFAELVDEWSLPGGYTLEWGGEFENSGDAQKSLAGLIPIVFAAMILIVIALFNSLKTPAVIFSILPFSIVGVTVGLLLLDQPFGFIAVLGFLSLSGMLIKNCIVLLDEINAQLAEGKAPYDAILDAGTSRLRPVSMAALTTILGLMPLIIDPFFAAMAVTIMFGLAFATVLTLVAVPVFYALIFRVKSEPAEDPGTPAES
jgi:multidrug efflux pump subunit AcrB